MEGPGIDGAGMESHGTEGAGIERRGLFILRGGVWEGVPRT